MEPPNQLNRRRPLAIRRAVASAVLLAAAVFLWFWTAGITYQPLPRLGVSIGALGISFSTSASDDGVHFRLAEGSGRRLEFRWRDFNRPAYHHGMVFNLLGVIVAAQPYTINDGDSILPPYAGIALPYWLLIVASAYGVLRWTGIAGWLAPYCRFGKAAWAVMIVVGLVFLALNAVPHPNPLAARTYDPGESTEQRLDRWLRRTFDPESFGDIEQHYGYPFCFNEIGIMGGQRVELYYGAEMHFRQHKLAENLCIALGTMLALGIAVELLSRRWRRQHSNER